MPRDLGDLLELDSREKLGLVSGVTATPVTPLAREWHRIGHEVSVFCLDPSVSIPVQLRGERLSIYVLPKRRFRKSLKDFYGEERRLICEAVEAEKPQVLSAQWSYEHALGALDTGVPTVVTCHDTPLRYAWISKSFFMTFHVLVAASVFRRAQNLVAVSPYTAGHISKLFSPRAVPVVIPNGLSTEIFERGRKRFRSLQQEKVTFNICSVGGWGTIKNISSLIEAFQLIRKSKKSAKLFLFGSGLGEGQEAQAWAKTRGLDKGIVFMGRTSRDEILDFLTTEIDLMIHPSLIECHPMVLIESVACGVPVLAGANSGGVAWTLGEGSHGNLCDVRDASEIASAALSMMNDRPKLRVSAEKSWHEIREKFGIDTVAALVFRVLERIAK